MADTTIILHDYDHASFTGALLEGTSAGEALTGGIGSDILVGSIGADTLEGGAGADLLIGGDLHQLTGGGPHATHYTTSGAGADTFVFNFGIDLTEGQTFYFRPNEDGTGGDTPNQNANVAAWNNYLDQLNAWRAAMDEEYGGDANTDTVQAYATVKKELVYLDDYDNSYTVGGSLAIISHDGTDTILKFGKGDKLELKGLANLSEQQFDQLFDVALVNGGTVLSWNGGSITIDGLEISTVTEFYTRGTDGDWFI